MAEVQIPIIEMTDTDVLRWLVGKFRCLKESGSPNGRWILPACVLEFPAESPVDAILDQIAKERQEEDLLTLDSHPTGEKCE